VKDVGTKEGFAVFLEKDSCIPAMGQVRGTDKTEAVLAGLEHGILRHGMGRAHREVAHVDQGADFTAYGKGIGGDLQPFVEGTAFIDFEMAEPDPPEVSRVDQAAYGFAQGREHPFHARVVKHGLVVPDQEMVELQVHLRHVQGDAEYVRCDFCDIHVYLL